MSELLKHMNILKQLKDVVQMLYIAFKALPFCFTDQLELGFC